MKKIIKTITKIEVQKKDKSRCSVFINEEFAFGMSLDSVITYDIQKGNQYTEEEYQELLRKLQYEQAKAAALRYIDYSPRTIQQTRDKLHTLEYEEGVIEQTLEFLLSYGFLNDADYAKQFIRSRITSKKHGRHKISHDLMTRGISKDISWPILEGYQEEEYEGALYLYKRRTKGRELTDYKDKAKVIRYLQSRGYPYEMIRDVMQEATEGYN